MENPFAPQRQRVPSSSIPEIFTDTAVIDVEQIGFKLVEKANGLIYFRATKSHSLGLEVPFRVEIGTLMYRKSNRKS